MDYISGKLDSVVPDNLLSSLERDFNEAMNALSDDGSLEQFRLEYEKLYGALKKSHESEKRLMDQCQTLTQELLSNAAKMQAAVKLSEEDHTTIEALKQEMEKAWIAVDSSNEKDRQASETAKTLQEEVKKLQRILEDVSVLPDGHTSTMEELKLENKRLEAASEDLNQQIDTCSSEVREMAQAEKEAEAAAQSDSAELQDITERLEVLRQDLRREKNSSERTKFQLQELVRSIRVREKELHSLEEQESELKKSVETYTEQIAQYEKETAALDVKLEMANKQLYHTQQTHNDTVDTTTDTNERMQAIARQIQSDEQQLTEMRKETTRVMRVKENDLKEISKLKLRYNDLQQQLSEIEQQQVVADRQMKRVALEKKRLDEVNEFLAQQAASAERSEQEEKAKIHNLEQLIAIEEENHEELHAAIAREREIIARLQSQIKQEEAARDKSVVELSRIEMQHKAATDELQLATIAVEDAQRKIQESEAKFAEQQAKYEQARVERNQLSKQLADMDDEIAETKQTIKMMDNQIRQYDDEIKLNEKKLAEAVSREKKLQDRLAREQNMEREHAERAENSTKESEALKDEIGHLMHVIEKHDKDLAVHQASVHKLKSEHDTLNSQLDRRNEKLTLLYEKLDLEQAALRDGEMVYRGQVDDLLKLRKKMKEEQRQAMLATNQCSDLKELKSEALRLQNEIDADETAIMALSEELEDPQSQTRWRHIGGKDPAPEDLQARLTRLQKQLIIKSEESLEQDMQLQEKERLAVELQTILDRQPGIEVAGQLNTYRQALFRKNAQMKQIAAELNMTSTQMSELNYEAERLRRQIRDSKREYYTTKFKIKEFLQSNGVQSTNTQSDDA